MFRWFLPVFLGLGTILSGPRAQLLAQEKKTATPLLIPFDKSGKLEISLKDLEAKYPRAAPTHIIVMAHGWNNSKTRASETYAKMAHLLARRLEKHPLRPKEFRPWLVGVRWPSLAWEDDAGFELAVGELEKILKENVHPKWVQIVPVWLEALERFQKANPLVVKVGLKVVKKTFPDLEFDPVVLMDAKLLEKKNLAEVIRVFSFYQMKQRAGEVGKEGVRPVLESLQKRYPEASIHLVGHSFGCKLLLSCLAEGELQRPVDSLVLLQAAVSQYAFAEALSFFEDKTAGAYCKVPRRVNGPILATFSKKDQPLSYAYPLAALAAGHVGEVALKKRQLSPDAYWALGAKGFGQVEAKVLEKGQPFSLTRGLFSIDAETLIAGHSGVLNDDVAGLIAAAVLRKRP